ncbi:unnamed protein product, partial [marine sediment metagenome]
RGRARRTPSEGGRMQRGERPFRLLANLMLRRFYGSVTIKFEAGKVTHVETETRRVWQYKDLPEETRSEPEGIITCPARTCVGS